MISLRPWTLHGADDRRLVALADSLVGERLKSVRYVVSAGANWPQGQRCDEVHEVDHSVELFTETGDLLVVSWATKGFDEGLAIDFNSDSDLTVRDLVERIEVAAYKEWRPFLGGAISGLAVAFHALGERSQIAPWSFRIGFANGVSVVFALGEMTEHELRYMPNSVLVIFDEMTARSYQIESSIQTSWGEVVGR